MRCNVTLVGPNAVQNELLQSARPVRPSDLLPPSGTGPSHAVLDDSVDLPRERPAAVREALQELADRLDEFAADLAEPLADPVAHRTALLADVDDHLVRVAELAVTAGGFGLRCAGWGELTAWRRDRFRAVLAAAAAAADRMSDALAAAEAKIEAYERLPRGAPDDVAFALLQQAERLLTTTPTSPRPDRPSILRASVALARLRFTGCLDDLTALARTDSSTLSGLLREVDRLQPVSAFDAQGLDLTSVEEAVIAFLADLLARVTDLRAQVGERLTAADAALARYDNAASGRDRVSAAVAAIQAMLGPDALAVHQFTVPEWLRDEWRDGLRAAERGEPTAHLRRDFPVDDWLHGVARVRPKMALWERISLLAEALGGSEPALLPVQFPFEQDAPWLGLELPAGQQPRGDRLLYTAHYGEQPSLFGIGSGLLIDEWTETLPTTAETTGIAVHYNAPGAEPPQAMLLVVPPTATATWNGDDLIAALHETFDLARSRAVEPTQIDRTPYALVLPATTMAATAEPITISTDLSVNNDSLRV